MQSLFCDFEYRFLWLVLLFCRDAGDREPAEICPFVKSRIDAFVGDAPQFDDITMLALKFVGKT